MLKNGTPGLTRGRPGHQRFSRAEEDQRAIRHEAVGRRAGDIGQGFAKSTTSVGSRLASSSPATSANVTCGRSGSCCRALLRPNPKTFC